MNQYPGGTIAEGQNAVNVLQDQTERWGDYTAAVLEPGTDVPSIWVCGSITNSNGLWENRIARINGGTDTLAFRPEEIHVTGFPNPFTNQLNLEIQLVKGAAVQVHLYSKDGKLIKTFLEDNLSRGVNRFTFRNLNYSQGMYYLRVVIDGELKYAEPLVIKE